MKKGESHQRALRPQRRAPDLGGPPGLHRASGRSPTPREGVRARGVATLAIAARPPTVRAPESRVGVCERSRVEGGGGGRRPWGLWGRTFGLRPLLDTGFSGVGAFACPCFLSFFLSFDTHRSQSSALQAARPHMHTHTVTRLRVTHGDATATGTAAAVDSWPARASAADWGLCSPGGKTQCTHFTSTLQTSDALN